MKTSRKVLVFVAPLLFIPLTIVIASIIISPPRTGAAIAAKKGLKRPLAIAHRGASFYAPELTLPSFALARDLGADYVETDVQRTRDGVLINFSDSNLSRTTDVAGVFPGRDKDPVSSFTWAELQRLDAGTWFNRKHPDRAKKGFAGLKIPSFRQYLNLLASGRNRPGLLIELKNPGLYPGMEKELLAALRNGGWLDEQNNVIVIPAPEDAGNRVTTGLGPRRIILQSFNGKSLTILKDTAPSVMRSYLVMEDADKKNLGFTQFLETAVALDAEMGLSGHLAFPWNIGPAHRKGKAVFVYTIDRPWHFMLFSFFGIDGMITNRCDAYLDFIGRGVSAEPSRLLKQYE